MLVWIIAIMGIAASFIVKFLKRTAKNKPSMLFWITDNIWELIASALFMCILLIIGDKIVFDESAILAKIPFVKALPFDLIFAAIAGYYNNILWYAVIKKLKGK